MSALRGWQVAATLASRLILAAIFLMAGTFKFIDLNATAALISQLGLPLARPLGVAAGIFEVAVAVSLIRGRLLVPLSLMGAVYVLGLGVLFHGPAMWTNPLEFAIFTYHFVFIAALLGIASARPSPAQPHQ